MRSVFYGTKGTIICDNKTPYIQLFEDNEELGKKFSDAPQEIPVTLADHNTIEEIRVFVDALKSGGKMPVSSAEGAYTVAVCCAALESVKIDAPVKVKYPKV